MRHRMRLFTFLLLVPLLSACPAEGGDGDADADADADADLEAGALAPTGAVGDTCAPNDGAALDVVIGSTSSCTEAPGAEPQVRFYAFPASTSGLTEGDAWSFDAPGVPEGLSAEWFPDGAGGNHEPATSGALEVLSVSGDEAVVDYEFVTAGGDRFEGQATLLVCPSDPMCG